MGRRSRARSATAGPEAAERPAAQPTRPVRPQVAAGRPRRATNPAIPGRRAITPARGTIALFLVLAVVLAGLVVVGVALLNGLLGAVIVLAIAVGGGLILRTWAERRLAGLELTEEDRTFRMLATGLLLIAAALAVAAFVVSLIA